MAEHTKRYLGGGRILPPRVRADMTASEQRMEYFLDQAEAALKRGDAQAAKRNLHSAEGEVSKLESFLGR